MPFISVFLQLIPSIAFEKHDGSDTDSCESRDTGTPPADHVAAVHTDLEANPGALRALRRHECFDSLVRLVDRLLEIPHNDSDPPEWMR